MNSVFHPPGKNPFQLPPRPQTHYLPSPAKETLDKSITLTPQKPKHRHEYSLPPEVYTPEQYSISEEESLFRKPPLPSTPNKDNVAVDLRKYLDDVTSWGSSQFCEQWPSRDTERSGPSPQAFLREAEMRSREPLSSTQRSSQRPATVKMKTSFASDRNLSQIDTDRNSEITRRLNRFRYGDPRPPQERKREQCKLPLPSVSVKKTPIPSSPRTSSRQKEPTSKDSLGFSQSLIKDTGTPVISSHTKSVQHSATVFSDADVTATKSTAKTTSPDPRDHTLSTLDSRLEKLLQESTSVMTSPGPRVSSHESTVPTSAETSGNFDSKVSSLGSDDFKTQLTLEKSREVSHVPVGRADPRKLPMCNPPLITYRRDVGNGSPPRVPVHVSPRKTRQEDDILYQWRLRRKLETARDDVAKGKGNNYMEASQKPRPFMTAERPLGEQQAQGHEYARPANIRGTFQAEAVQDYTQFGHKVSCSCQGGTDRPSSPRQVETMGPMQDEARAPTPEDTTAPRTGCRMSYSPTRPKKSVGVGVTLMKSMETQTGRSLLLSEDTAPTYGKENGGSAQQSASDSSLPHTSTPASSVSFHRVKIVPAEAQNSPVTSKGSPQARVMSPLSSKTDATTIWSSTDQIKDAKSESETQAHRSPVSSVKRNRHFASDSETFSPTTNVVSEVVGARLFNVTQTPASTHGVARLRQTKMDRLPTEENDVSGMLSSSYTSTLRNEPQKIPQETDTASECSKGSGNDSTKVSEERVPPMRREDEKGVSPHVQDFSPSSSKASSVTQGPRQPEEFDPLEMFEKLLSEIENDPGDFADDPVLRTLRSQRDEFLAEYRAIEREIEDACEDIPEKDPS